MKYAPLALMIFFCGCEPSRPSVDAAMKQYDSLLKTMDAHAIANMFVPDGELGNVAKGRDSIEKFLSQFKDVKVLSQQSTSNYLMVDQDTAVQKGNYTQVDVRGTDTLRIHGEYTGSWLWMRGEGWRIKRMDARATQ